ncbi:MAG: VOC family protein [Thermoleophilia bacterium]|nr:VOC family protein [Thermoleophilia bacterium]
MIGSTKAVACIPVRDLESARRFYEDTLGCEVLGQNEGGLMLAAGDGSELFVYPTEHAGTARHTLVSFRTDHVDDEIAELKDHGVTFETYPDMPGVSWDGEVAVMGEAEARGVWFTDPDGNILGLFQMVDVPALA